MERTPRFTLAVAAAVVVLTSVACAPALYSSEGSTRTYLGFSVGITNAPPPPRMHYRSAPSYQVVELGVRVVDSPDDCDLFQYGGNYYLYSSNYWYVSNRYDGSYRIIDVQRVPRAVLEVPDHRWRHHPRGHAYGHRKHGGHDDDDDQH